MKSTPLRFNPPPGWPQPPEGWQPPKGWTPDPTWPDPPEGWQLWLAVNEHETDGPTVEADTEADKTAESSRPGRSSNTEQPDQVRLLLLEEENRSLKAQLLATTDQEEVVLSDELVLQDVGVYRYHHVLENAVAYKERLRELNAKIAELVKSRRAIVRSNLFTFNGSLAQGRKMSADLSRLMLRAYNAEVDVCLRTLRAGNIVTAKKRIERSKAAIAKLGRMMEMEISDDFHRLRIQELELTSDFLIKKQEEKEAAREERARLREERRAQAELAAERERLHKERDHLFNALETLRADGSVDLELEAKLSELEEAIAHNDYRIANIRAGYVYIVSNRGAFGRDVVKIGLTRRLQPTERVTELSGASVPFRFDVHALFFSEDAVSLEAELHRHFESRRLNQANSRKEFFFATPAEAREVLEQKVGNLLEYVEEAEATEYLQSLNSWPEEHRRSSRRASRDVE